MKVLIAGLNRMQRVVLAGKIIILFSALCFIFGWVLDGSTYQKKWSEEFHPEHIFVKACYKCGAFHSGSNQEPVRLDISLLEQPFYYLGQGRQVYAFDREDGAVVIKFFKQQRLSLSPVILRLPSIQIMESWKSSKYAEIERRKNRYFSSCLLAYEKIPEHTGLVYLSLGGGPDSHPGVEVKLYDDKGTSYSVDIGKTVFFIQKKAQPLLSTIEQLMAHNQEAAAKQRIDQILLLFYECAQKGILDKDTGIARRENLGFLEDRCIFIDVGTLRSSKSTVTKKEFLSNISRLCSLHDWLKSRFPSLAIYFKEREEYYAEKMDL